MFYVSDTYRTTDTQQIQLSLIRNPCRSGHHIYLCQLCSKVLLFINGNRAIANSMYYLHVAFLSFPQRSRHRYSFPTLGERARTSKLDQIRWIFIFCDMLHEHQRSSTSPKNSGPSSEASWVRATDGSRDSDEFGPGSLLWYVLRVLRVGPTLDLLITGRT